MQDMELPDLAGKDREGEIMDLEMAEEIIDLEVQADEMEGEEVKCQRIL